MDLIFFVQKNFLLICYVVSILYPNNVISIDNKLTKIIFRIFFVKI